ncbi:MAG: Histone acetyltransferase HPA2-like protein [Candidatus Solibacter sp.]|nr:Histone acetyltransferase HPA2-like protein [Candidatus Solibacter sp.]
MSDWPARLLIREPRSGVDFGLYYDLRWRILREPWTQQRETARDEYEDTACHIMAFCGEQLVGVGRLHFNSADEAQVRYMAVEDGFQGKGVGSNILTELEKRAWERGARRIVLNAREGAVHFYERHGYERTEHASELFGISHWEMEKRPD